MNKFTNKHEHVHWFSTAAYNAAFQMDSLYSVEVLETGW